MTKKLLILFGVIVSFIAVLAVLAVLLINFFFSPDRIRYMIIGNVSASLNQQVSVEKVETELFKGRLAVRGLEIFSRQDRKGGKKVLARAEDIIFIFDVLSPLKGRFLIKQLSIVRPKIYISRVPEIKLTEEKYKKRMFSMVNTSILEFRIEDGEINSTFGTLFNKPITLSRINISAGNLNGVSPFSVRLASDINLGKKTMRLSGDVRLDPVAKALDINARLVLGNSSVVAAGTLNSFIENPVLDMKISAGRSFLSELSGVMAIPRYLAVFSENNDLEFVLRGPVGHPDIAITNR